MIVGDVERKFRPRSLLNSNLSPKMPLVDITG